MAFFLKRTLLFISPIIVLAIVLELMLRGIPNDYKQKVKYLDQNSNKIEILILGSSHSFYGVNPQFFSSNAYNAAYVSQSIDIDYKIIEKYERNWDSLQLIIIPIDYFTLFGRLENGQESWRLKNYEIYYNLNVTNRIKEHFELSSNSIKISFRKLKRYYLLNNTSIGVSELGFGIDKKKQRDLFESGIQAVERHTKIQLNYEDNAKVLANIIEYSKNKGIKLLFFTTPAYKTYTENIDKNQLLLTLKVIDSLVSRCESCYYFNLLKDSDFLVEDFRDADHLNQSGAMKLSKKLNELAKDSI